MPTYGVALFFMVDRSAAYFTKTELKLLLLIMTFIFTFILPLINSLYLLRTKYIRSLQMETKEERRLPLLMTAIFFAAEYWMLHDRAIPEELKLLLLSGTLALVLTVMVNLFWKISAHMVGLGGITGGMFVISSMVHYQNAIWLIIILLFISGITGMSRMLLKAHTSLEIFGGFILGAGCPLIFLYT